MRFSYRSYKDGDADAINELYRIVTGRRRTIDQYTWQWLSSPAGQSEIWLIEVELEDGSKKLIGHHGVMAEEFTFRGIPVRVGKTENTMVLPDFREKLLYIRFEKAFLSHYQDRFGALFSTMGPEPAIRLRQALGYKAENHWVKIYFGAEPSLSFNLLCKRLLSASLNFTEKFEALSGTHKFRNSTIFFLAPDELNFDFDGFWEVASQRYGLTPSRHKRNLAWRFWQNPYRKHYTLKLENPAFGIGICILSIRGAREIFIDDIFCEYPKKTSELISTLRNWLTSQLSYFTLTTDTTEDCFNWFDSPYSFKKSWLHYLMKRDIDGTSNKMPRKITSLGETKRLDHDADWYITPFIFEGY